MKSLISMMVAATIVSMWVTFAPAMDWAALDKEATQIENHLAALEKEYNANEAKVPGLKQRMSDLEWSGQKVVEAINKHNQEQAQLDSLMLAHDAVISNQEAKIMAHNSRCSGEHYDQGFVDACNAEAARLNSESAVIDAESTRLNGEQDYMDQKRDTINGLIDNQIEQERILNNEIDAYNAHRKELVDAGVKLEARYNEIMGYVNECQMAIASGNEELMKSKCGEMFDGNTSPDDRLIPGGGTKFFGK